MEQGKNNRKESRATFAEFVRSIKFNGKRAASNTDQQQEQGFAVNRSQHVGVAAMDDYKQLILSNN